jgi:hypothetical protein
VLDKGFIDVVQWGEQYLNICHWGAVTGTSAVDPKAIEEAGSMDVGRGPAWDAKDKLSENPGELDHLVCCRDVEWRRALCGYIHEDPSQLHDSDTVCTRCIETAESMGTVPGDRQCPIDKHPCPDEVELQRMIDDRISGTT